ncbi:MAG: leucine-rich repeat domain-containing protein [Treponema sp.]|nr:leucine-rich repeat domain-containing protein [Treponema sp.]
MAEEEKEAESLGDKAKAAAEKLKASAENLNAGKKAKSFAGKAKDAINKLPFNTMAQKVPALAKFAAYANYAFCVLVLLLLVLILRGGKGKSSDTMAMSEPTGAIPAWALNDYDGDYHEVDEPVENKNTSSKKKTKPAELTTKWSKEAKKAFKTAKVVPESDLRYELTDDEEGVRITAYTGTAEAISLPSKIEGLPVREIQKEVFAGDVVKAPVSVVIIPDSVTKLGSMLFYKNTDIEYVQLPSAIEAIPILCFGECASMEEIVIPNSVTLIKGGAFARSGIRAIVIPDSVIEIEEKTFMQCHDLELVQLSSNIKKLPYGILGECESLGKLIIPNGVEEINGYSFGGASIKELVLPDSMTEMSFFVEDIKTINLPASLTKCTCIFSGLEEVIIPNTLKQVEFGERTFEKSHPSLATQKRLRELGYKGKFAQ